MSEPAAPAPVFPFALEYVIGDADVGELGHVNNAKYFSWFDDVRIALFASVGVPLDKHGIVPVVATTTCDFLRGVVAPATIRVGVRIVKLGETSASVAYEIVDVTPDPVAPGPYARGTAVVVFLEYAKKAKWPLPASVRAALTAL